MKVLVFSSLLLLPGTPAAAENRFGASVTVAVARRQVRVLDERRCIAEHVGPGDLIFFAGRRALATRIHRSDEPLRLLVVVDASFSMAGRRLALAEQVARRLLDELHRVERRSQAAVAVFDDEVYWLTPEGFTGELCPVAERVCEAVAGGGTALWRALDSALDVAELAPSARPTAIVVATDGEDNSDRTGELAERVERRSVRLGIPVFAIAIPPKQYLAATDPGWEGGGDVRCSRAEWMPRALDRERRRLLRLCAATGGAMYAPREEESVGALVDFVLAQIRDVHEVEAEIPDDLASAAFELDLQAIRPGLRLAGIGTGPAKRR